MNFSEAIAWSYLHGFIKLRGLLKMGRTTSIIFHSNWRPYLMLSVPALRFEVLHGRVSLVGCKDGNLLAVRSFSGWNDFILWKKNPSMFKSVWKSYFFLTLKYESQQKKTHWQDCDFQCDLSAHFCSYQWCHYQSSPSPGWQRKGNPPRSPQ